MNTRHTRWTPQLLVVSVLACLVLAALPQMGHVLGQAPSFTMEASSTQVEPAADIASGPDCAHPPAGRQARLRAETEIVVAYRESNNKGLVFARLDDDDDPDSLSWDAIRADVLYDLPWLTDVRWPAITTADLNGDGAREAVMAFRNKDKELAAYLKTSQYEDYWTSVDVWLSSNDRHKGNIQYIDVAAGNLDGSSHSGDTADEVVIAFKDDKGDLYLVCLDNTEDGDGIDSDWGLPPSNTWDAQYWDAEKGRGDISHVAVATGDLNGDGVDDEIVVTFKDSGEDLQAMIFRWEPPKKKLTVLKEYHWTNLYREDVVIQRGPNSIHGIDVTTGDVDLDFQDEVILAFEDSEDQVQLLLLDNRGNLQFDDSVFIRVDPNEGYEDDDYVPKNVFLASGDLDGNGGDEIVLAYGTTHDDCYQSTYYHIRTFDYKQPGVLQQRDHRQGSGKMDEKGRMSLAVGDIDMDGRAEFTLGLRSDVGGLIVDLYDAESGPRRDRYVYDPPNGNVEEFWIDMGDYSGDSSYGNYTGNCWETIETQVTTVLHVPPHYSAYNRDTSEVALGKFIGGGSSTTEGTTTVLAGSITIDESMSFLDIFEVGPSVTYSYEKSLEVAHEEATMQTEGVHVSNAPDVGVYDLVVFDQVTYWVYEYRESLSNVTFTLRIPKASYVSSRRLDLWYKDGPTEFPDSWVPVGVNVAREREATQSGTLNDGFASRAVDGNVDGDFWNGSVTHTDWRLHAWWQVDLGRVQWLDAIQVWNRTGDCANRLSNFYVFVSDDSFPSDDLTTLINDPDVWHYHVPGQGGRPTTIIPDCTGRHVRIQLTGNKPLSLAEVQVWGHPSEVKDVKGPQWPEAQPIKLDADRFKIELPGGNYQRVDGRLLWTWNTNSGIAVEKGSGVHGWSLKQDEAWSQNEITSTAEGMTLGFEAKVAGFGPEGAYTQGSETRTSRALMWSETTLIEGQTGPLPTGTPDGLEYIYVPYLWIQEATSTNGVSQEFLVLDYWVSSIGLDKVGSFTSPRATAGITPTAPLIASPSHPDPATWVPTSTVVLTWTQPAGDPATIAGYGWYMDDRPNTDIGSLNMGLTTTHTYRDVQDGLWYGHVRATGDGGEQSAMAHRAVRVDTHPPQVALALDPPLPTGDNGWYTSPVTVSVTATDGTGSGVVEVEISTDGSTWQPYVAPLQYTTDTVTTTLWARATDAISHTSAPVSTTFKIDMTPPSSKIDIGGQIVGVWVAHVVTDTLGNQHMVLGGVITDSLSGRCNMDLLIDGVEGTGATAIGTWHPFPSQPDIEVNWYYTATTELGRGNHIFQGRARDEAGNLEAFYQIAQFIWFPPSAPDLSGSSLTVTPQVARPGDEVTFVIAVRNSGEQEAHVALTNTLPIGLTPITETLGYGVAYDPLAGTITWPARLLWPGEWTRVRFDARVDAAGAAILENQIVAHAFWPNTDALTGAARQHFLDREDTVVLTATVIVDPGLPAGADVTPPQVALSISSGPVVREREVALDIWADADARWMSLREWTLHPISGTWVLAQESGWVHYTPTYTWALSPGDGVKYLGVWVADRSRNVSLLDEHGLAYTNLIGDSHTLPDGGRAQYRFDMTPGDLVAFYVTNLAGDPDLYVWKPLNAFRPNCYSNSTGGPGEVDETGDWVDEAGMYLVEVAAVGDSQYALSLAWEFEMDAESRSPEDKMLSLQEKERPEHPLTISNPLSAGDPGTPSGLPPVEIYLPLVFTSE
jgi:uncharacterized repeat protein (TIGR01451 family)